MQRQKRVYYAKNDKSWIVCGILLSVTMLVVLTGLLYHRENSAFEMQLQPVQTAIPVDEKFDETQATVEYTLPSICGYAVQLGCFDNRGSAESLVNIYRARGAAGFIWEDGKYRVLAAVYPNKQNAQLVREQLKEQHSIDSYLFEIEMPTIVVKLSGMRGQLDIFQAAFVHAEDLAKQLQEVSVAADRRETNTEELLEKLRSAKSQVDVVALRLKQRFSNPVPSTVQALIDLFERFSTFVSEVSANQSLVELSMETKYRTLAVLWDINSIYRALNHT